MFPRFGFRLKMPQFQRSALLILLLVLIGYQWLQYMKKGEGNIETNAEEMAYYQAQLDSLKALQPIHKPKVFLINPNYMSDYNAYVLGLSPEAFDRIQAFTQSGKRLKSLSEFQKIAQLPDSSVSRMSKRLSFPITRKNYKEKAPVVKKELNKATAEDLQQVRGIGEVLSERIVKFRAYLKGFLLLDQLHEVYGLDSLVVDRIENYFYVSDTAQHQKIDLATASLDDLVQIPYLTEKEALKLIAYRSKTKSGNLEILSEVFADSPNKIERLKLYLQ